MEKRYSKIYKIEGREFRYDYKNALLELVYKNENGDIEMLDAIGLSREGWKYDKEGYLHQYHIQVEEELAAMLAHEVW